MQNIEKISYRIGLLVFVSLIVLVALLLGAGGEFFLKSTYKVTVLFDYAGGINVGTPIYMGGVRIGKVSSLEAPTPEVPKVKMTLRIASDVRIKKDANLSIESVGLIGERILEFSIGSPSAEDLPTDGTAVIDGTAGPSLASTQMKIEAAFTELKNTLAKLSEFISSAKTKEGFQNTIENINKFAQQGANAFKDIDKTAKKIKGTLDEFKPIISELRKVTNNISETATNINKIVKKISEGEGTVGKLVFNDELHNNLNHLIHLLTETSKDLNKTLDNIQRISEKMLSETGTVGNLINNNTLHSQLIQAIDEVKKTLANISQATVKFQETITLLKENPDAILGGPEVIEKRRKKAEKRKKFEQGLENLKRKGIIPPIERRHQ